MCVCVCVFVCVLQYMYIETSKHINDLIVFISLVNQLVEIGFELSVESIKIAGL